MGLKTFEEPNMLENEASVLRSLGLQEWEIEFLMHEKFKQNLANHWRD